MSLDSPFSNLGKSVPETLSPVSDLAAMYDCQKRKCIVFASDRKSDIRMETPLAMPPLGWEEEIIVSLHSKSNKAKRIHSGEFDMTSQADQADRYRGE